jgi:DNA-directed RNA polymerase subunit RPC12/RpoP
MDAKPFNTLSILAKYYYHCFGYRKKKITTLLLDYLSKYYPRYELNELSWQTSVEKIAGNAGSFELFEISGVRITKDEMETIRGLRNKVLERLAFTMLCLAKLNNIKNPKNKGWVNADSKEIFNYARISCKADEREVKIGQLWQKGLLDFSKRNDNLNCRVIFINDDSEEELFVSDFRELGYEYLLYRGENFIRCADCGILTRGNKAGTKKYCKDCATYTPQGTKTIVCVDCGKEFEVAGNNKRTMRCDSCQNAINREKKRLWKRQNSSK